jgi:hypothetical protein
LHRENLIPANDIAVVVVVVVVIVIHELSG